MKSLSTSLLIVALIVVTIRSGATTIAQQPVSNDNAMLAERVIELEQEVARLNHAIQGLQLTEQLTGRWIERTWIRNGERIDESKAVYGGGGGGSGGPVEWRLATDVDSQRWILAPEPVFTSLGQFSVDASKAPAWIDFHVTKNGKRHVIRGIVSCKYKQARIAIPTTWFDGETIFKPPRPTSFESTKENGYSVYDLNRASFARTGVF